MKYSSLTIMALAWLAGAAWICGCRDSKGEKPIAASTTVKEKATTEPKKQPHKRLASGETAPPQGYKRKKSKSGNLSWGEAWERARQCGEKLGLVKPINCLALGWGSPSDMPEGYEKPYLGCYHFQAWVSDRCARPEAIEAGLMHLPLGSVRVNIATGSVEFVNRSSEVLDDEPNYKDCLPPGHAKDEPRTINDIKKWRHPTKAVFEKTDIEVTSLYLTERQTFPTFTVTMPEYFDTTRDKQKLRALYDQLCEANFGYSFALDDRTSGIKTTVECGGNVAIGGKGMGW